MFPIHLCLPVILSYFCLIYFDVVQTRNGTPWLIRMKKRMIAKLICGSLMFVGRFTNINYIYFDFIDEKKRKLFYVWVMKRQKKKIVAFLEIGDILRFICYNNLLFSFSEKIDFWQNDIFEKLGVI